MGSVRRSRSKESLFLDLAESGRIIVGRDGRAWLDEAPMPQHGNGRGYRLSRVLHEGKRYSMMHHCLVWSYFNGPIPAGMEINHVNGDKLDNRLANLELTTRAGNLLHACRTGLRDQPAIARRSMSRESHGSRKLTDGMIREIRARCAAGVVERVYAKSAPAANATGATLTTSFARPYDAR